MQMAVEAERRQQLELEANAANQSTGGQAAHADGAIHCPKCGSTQITANKKGFGLGKAAVGGLLLGPVGLLGGLIGGSKINITCLKCGNVFKAGEGK